MTLADKDFQAANYRIINIQENKLISYEENKINSFQMKRNLKLLNEKKYYQKNRTYFKKGENRIISP